MLEREPAVDLKLLSANWHMPGTGSDIGRGASARIFAKTHRSYGNNRPRRRVAHLAKKSYRQGHEGSVRAICNGMIAAHSHELMEILDSLAP
jgi:hypothetical protein